MKGDACEETFRVPKQRLHSRLVFNVCSKCVLQTHQTSVVSGLSFVLKACYKNKEWGVWGLDCVPLCVPFTL